MERIKTKIEPEISDNQNGFRKGKGTREGISNMRTIGERYLEKQKDIYICFIDYEKAFDRVNHTAMILCLQDRGVDSKDLRFITYMYWNQYAAVRTQSGLSDDIKIKRGVRQGCILSSVLFNLYTDIIFRSMKHLKGVVIGGDSITDSRYADDTALLAESEEEVQETLDLVNSKGKELNMKMNAKKTKTVVVTMKQTVPSIRLKIDGQEIEQVSQFTYLGQQFTENGKNEHEIKRRIEIARSTFNRIKPLLHQEIF